MKLLWMRPTESGLCDRLCDFLFMLGYARVHNATLHAEWPEFKIKDIDTSHRALDILLPNILQYMRLPPDLFLNGEDAYDEVFDHGIGGGIDYLTFHGAHLASKCDYTAFEAAIKTVARDFCFCPEISHFLKTLPAKFVSLHIRRGDKVRDGQHDGYFILRSELDQLNQVTFNAIDYYLGLGYSNFFVCGDEDLKKKPFVDYLTSKGANIIEIPKMEKWRSTFYDMAVMTKSDFNIASQRYSNFSRFPALIGQGQFRTVFGFEI